MRDIVRGANTLPATPDLHIAPSPQLGTGEYTDRICSESEIIRGFKDAGQVTIQRPKAKIEL